jgi:hypothetical protein
MKHYECSICKSINHAAKLHCSTCGTVPACYSVIGQPHRLISDDTVNDWPRFIPVVVARGAERLESRRAHKVYFRTVPLDYYA